MTFLSRLKDRYQSNVYEMFGNNIPIQYKIFAIIATAGAISNTIGFIANLLLYGTTVPTVFCGICAILTLLYIFFVLHTENYLVVGFILFFVLIIIEFPLLALAYGPVMYPYIVLGFLVSVMLDKGLRRIIASIILGLFDCAVIVISLLLPNLMGTRPESSELVGSALVTFIVTVCTLMFCMVSWQNIYTQDSRFVDGVTGLLSREGFIKSLKKTISSKKSINFSIVCFDIKGFKAVNALHGTTVGNEVLRYMGEYLNSSFLKPYAIARFHSDIFMCLVNSDYVNNDKINSLCKFYYEKDDRIIKLSMTSGVYNNVRRDEDLSTICDKVLTLIKYTRQGKGIVVAEYNDEIEESFINNSKFVKEIEKALINKDFTPYFQPIVNTQTREIVGAEALARWIHSEEGIISPARFIPILEEKEMISELDSIIVNKVNDFLLSREDEKKRNIPISINFSRNDLYNNRFLEIMKEIISNDKLDKSLCRFELTESSIVSMPQAINDALKFLRKAGASVVIDDFGIGYSSLGMISNFSFDIVKLDKSFIDNIEESQKNIGIVRSIIDLCHNLGAKVVAEGIEKEEQYNILKDLNCDLIQGYYFYKPMSMEDFANLIDK